MYLIDTHILLWATSYPDKLDQRATAILSDEDNRIFVSIGTLWKLSIKSNLGKIALPEDFLPTIPNLGYEILDIHIKHLETYQTLPILHRDPFDRLLIAQAISENLTLITQDVQILKYEVQTASRNT